MTVRSPGSCRCATPSVLARRCAPPGAPAPRHPCDQTVPAADWKKGICVLAGHCAAVVLLAALAAAEVTSGGGAGTLTAAFDRPKAPVGDVATLTLSFQLPEGGAIPDPPVLGGVEQLTILGRETAPNRIALKVLVDQLETLKTGPITLGWLDKERKLQTLTAPAVSLQALSNLGDKPAEAQLRPLQDIVPVRPAWLRYAPWGLGALGLILAAAGLYWWLKKRRRARELAEREEPPHLRAVREVERLEAQKLFEKGRVKEFYFRLSEILRRYLEAIRGFPAAEYTVEEIARSVHDERDRQLLVLLRQADLVKFADVVPTAARKDEEVSAARAYIGATAPAPEQQPPGSATAGTRR